MNILTVTLSRGNYGSVLQAFALQKKIVELGGNPLILKRSRSFALQSYKIFSLAISLCRCWHSFQTLYGVDSLGSRIKLTFRMKTIQRRFQKVQEFADKNLRVLKINDFQSYLSNLSGDRDVLLAGSDQVWGVQVRIAPSPDSTFAWAKDRTDIKKYSYAASIGVGTLSEEQIDGFRKALAHFEVASFREKQAFDILESRLACPARNDVDPTLLYDSSFWSQFAAPAICRRPYVFAYVLSPDVRVLNIARRIAKEHDLEIVFVDNWADRPRGVITRYDLGVDEFLSGIQNAEYVVTNSFHGAAFSNIFHKRFVAVKHPSGNPSRISNLLRIVGLDDRLIDSEDAWKHCLQEIDFVGVDAALDAERARSIEYLKEICACK